MAGNKYTKIEDLMDLTDFFDEPKNGMGKGPNSMDGMPPNNNMPFEQKMVEENMERQSKLNPLHRKMKNNVDMAKAMRGGNIGNTGSIYPSNPNMNFPPENTNPSYTSYNYQNNPKDAQYYKYGPKAYFLNNPGHNSYNNLNSSQDVSFEGFEYNHMNNHLNNHMNRNINCIEIANHIKSCPICSKFYENDKTIYVIAIIILVIICIILIKKVLENYEK
jgi:hypothetical protein